ncbi:putative zinc finger protein [Cardiosporidium cionae]|uniref:Zinc finger protein n=1 Tax=Cardiosporidium cionae TaxID=476202 RepID=A0ABQ7JD60_9APIC|nr:putative zinc finger protein [Cardiosporidium cionae]|eukprot:KAF8821850.1 putative zinc finger protein [Cardiosporidium cionae]
MYRARSSAQLKKDEMGLQGVFLPTSLPSSSIFQPPFSAVRSSYLRLKKKRKLLEIDEAVKIYVEKQLPAKLEPLPSRLESSTYPHRGDLIRGTGSFNASDHMRFSKQQLIQSSRFPFSLSSSQISSASAIPEEELQRRVKLAYAEDLSTAHAVKKRRGIGSQVIFHKSHQRVFTSDLSKLELAYLLQFADLLQTEEHESLTSEKKLEAASRIYNQQISAHVPLESIKCFYDDRKFRCQACGLRFKTSSAKSIHLNKHFEKDERQRMQSLTSKVVTSGAIKQTGRPSVSKTSWKTLLQWIYDDEADTANANVVSSSFVAIDSRMFSQFVDSLLKSLTQLDAAKISAETGSPLPPWFPPRSTKNYRLLAPISNGVEASAFSSADASLGYINKEAIPEQSQLQADFKVEDFMASLWKWSLRGEGSFSQKTDTIFANQANVSITPQSDPDRSTSLAEKLVAQIDSMLPICLKNAVLEKLQLREYVEDLLCQTSENHDVFFGSIHILRGASYVSRLVLRLLQLGGGVGMQAFHPIHSLSSSMQACRNVNLQSARIDKGLSILQKSDGSVTFSVINRNNANESSAENETIMPLGISGGYSHFSVCSQCIGKLTPIWNETFHDWFFLNSLSIYDHRNDISKSLKNALLHQSGIPTDTEVSFLSPDNPSEIAMEQRITRHDTLPLDTVKEEIKILESLHEKSYGQLPGDNSSGIITELKQDQLVDVAAEGKQIKQEESNPLENSLFYEAINEMYKKEVVSLEHLEYQGSKSVPSSMSLKGKHENRNNSNLWGMPSDISWRINSYDPTETVGHVDPAYNRNVDGCPLQSGVNIPFLQTDCFETELNALRIERSAKYNLLVLQLPAVQNPNASIQINSEEIDLNDASDIEPDFERSYGSLQFQGESSILSDASIKMISCVSSKNENGARTAHALVDDSLFETANIKKNPFSTSAGGIYPSYMTKGLSNVICNIETVHNDCWMRSAIVNLESQNRGFSASKQSSDPIIKLIEIISSCLDSATSRLSTCSLLTNIRNQFDCVSSFCPFPTLGAQLLEVDECRKNISIDTSSGNENFRNHRTNNSSLLRDALSNPSRKNSPNHDLRRRRF